MTIDHVDIAGIRAGLADIMEQVNKLFVAVDFLENRKAAERPLPFIKGKQCQVLIRHFDTKSSISPMEAWTIYGIRSLHRRILDLEANGWAFSRVRRTDPTGQRYMRYFMQQRGAR